MIIECFIIMLGLFMTAAHVLDEVLEQRRRETKTGEFEEGKE